MHFARTGAGGLPGVLAIWPENTLRKLQPVSLALLATVKAGALLATAKTESPPYDFVSRFFAPGMGVLEDPVTGSMHATLAPFWAERLNKTKLLAFQASERGGELRCNVVDGRVILSGSCALYMRGEIDF
jgi:predicted PhzF superfamily epimerase YddE/YHI9